MSVCGSPDSQRSSFSSAYTCSGSIPSPDTAATTPNSSCSASPKTGSQYVEYSTSPFQLPSSPDLDFSYGYDYGYDSGYGYTYPTSSLALMAPPPPAEYPFAYQYPELTSPPLPHPPQHPPPPPPPPPTSYHQPQQPLGYELPLQESSYASPPPDPPRPKYSGYPPASAFYGPQPPSRRYRRRGSRPSPAVDPERYRVEKWVTADGRKVEYSAMHLHCATM